MIELRWSKSHPADPFAVDVGGDGYFVLQYREGAFIKQDECSAIEEWTDWQDVEISSAKTALER